jgi:hypothetical protein
MFLDERIPQRETLYLREMSLFDHLYGILDVWYPKYPDVIKIVDGK